MPARATILAARGHQQPSCPAPAGHPVRPGLSVQSSTSLEYWITRPSAQLRTRRVMTTEYGFAISPHHQREFCWKLLTLSKNGGRREDRVSL
jgi:hypothetical protein